MSFAQAIAHLRRTETAVHSRGEASAAVSSIEWHIENANNDQAREGLVDAAVSSMVEDARLKTQNVAKAASVIVRLWHRSSEMIQSSVSRLLSSDDKTVLLSTLLVLQAVLASMQQAPDSFGHTINAAHQHMQALLTIAEVQDLSSAEMYSHGLHSYGLRSYGLHSYGQQVRDLSDGAQLQPAGPATRLKCAACDCALWLLLICAARRGRDPSADADRRLWRCADVLLRILRTLRAWFAAVRGGLYSQAIDVVALFFFGNFSGAAFPMPPSDSI